MSRVRTFGKILNSLSLHGLSRPMLEGNVLGRAVRWHGGEPVGNIRVNWLLKDGTEVVTYGKEGDNLLRLAQRNEIELEGACEGVCACSTCHIYLQDDVFDQLPEPTEAEDDMLDRAFGLKPTSRLGCQVLLEAKHSNMTVRLPLATRNFYVDGHVPKPH